MARIRSVKPETFMSDTLARLPVEARWTFVGLWTYCDDEGRGRGDARLVKAAVWPLEDVASSAVAGHLRQLEAARLICQYEIDGKPYLHVVNFAEHQKPQHPAKSKHPDCPRLIHGGTHESSVVPHEGSGGSHEVSAQPASSNGTAEQTCRSEAVSENPHEDLLRAHEDLPPVVVVRNLEGEKETPTVPRGEPRSETQRANDLAKAYVDLVPLSRFPAIAGIARQAIRSGRYGDEQIHAALTRLGGEGRSVTVETLRVELDGLPPPRVSRQQQQTDDQFRRALARARERDATRETA